MSYGGWPWPARLNARLWSRLLTAMMWGAALALVRGAGRLAQDVITVSVVRSADVGGIYDFEFAFAGVVFLVAGRVRRQRPAAETPPAGAVGP